MADAFKKLENNTNLSQSSKTTNSKGDPRGEYPTSAYRFRSSIEAQDYQLKKPEGGDPDIDIADIMATTRKNSSDYKNASIKRTKSGHVLMFDDALGEERILLMHKNGYGIEMRQDGTMIMRAENNIITKVGGSSVFMIEGDLKVSCKNIEVDATGDLDMRVTGDYNLNVGGDKKETITGSVVETIHKNKASIVSGDIKDIVTGTRTDYSNKDYNNIVKGNYDNTVEGDFEMTGKGKALVTSQTNVTLSSADINILTPDISILAAGGTIGGANVINYAKNYYGTSATFTAGVTTNGVTSSSGITAPTFHGSLKGIASIARSQSYGEAATSGGTAITDTATGATDTTATGQPTAVSMKTILEKSNYGVPKVSIDEGNFIIDKINIGPNTGGITEKALNIKEIRTKLKDPANNTNNEFINTLYAENRISNTYLEKIPPPINRSSDGNINYTAFKGEGSTQNISLIKGSPQVQPILPDKRYDPMRLPNIGPLSINLKALLGTGIPLSTFLKGTTLGHLATLEERQTLARQLLLQAEVIKFKKLSDEFNPYQLMVTEGVYKASAGEILTPGSVPFLAQTGRAIVYEMYDDRNISSPEILFNFATRLATNLFAYDKIIIDYDKLDPNPNADINVQIIVIMPEVDKDYNIVGAAQPLKKLETRYNNQVQSNTDLVQHL